MSDDEKVVRSAWEWVQVRLAEPFEGVAQGKWIARLPLLPFSQVGFDTESAAWFAAAAFTRERQEQVRQLKYELSLQRLFHSNFAATALSERNPHDHQADQDAIARTVSRLEAELARLTAGMREAQ